MLFALDQRGVVTAVGGHDRGLALALAAGRDDVVGLPAAEAWTDVPELRTACRRALTGAAHAGRFAWRAHQLEGSYQPTLDRRGRVTGVIGVLRDVTARARAVEAEDAWRARVAETERLAVLGSLAGGVAHQLNDALTAIRFSVGRLTSFELAQAGESPEHAHRVELLQDAREGLAKVEQIARHLRLFAQADPADVGPIDVGAVVDDAVGLAAHEIRHRAQLVCEVAPVPLVHGDPRALRRVLLHLLLNAAQAIPDDAKHQHVVRIATSCDQAGQVVIEVVDTGHGMGAAELARVFEPFFTTRGPGEGLGLGLAVCHDIVTAMHGRITASSEPGHGTRIRIALPPAAATPPMAPPALANAACAGRWRVLIVDDDRPVAAAIALELDEHDVVVAGSGREAFEILRHDPAFDVVLCDLMMPEVSGMALYECLRPLEPALVARFVFMTGGAFTSRAERFLREVPNPRLYKPFDPGALRALIARAAAERG